MKARQTLFHIWLVLTGIYWISGLLYDVDGIVLKFQTGSQSRWLVLGLAIMMAILVPMAVLVAGRTALWIADRSRAVHRPRLMALKLRPTGLGFGIYKDRPDYTVYSGGWGGVEGMGKAR